MDDAVRPRLYTAATHLALLTAWMHFDVEHHDAARRLWTVGLEIPRGIEHPLSTDLTAHILFDMAQQSLYLDHRRGRPSDPRHHYRHVLAAQLHARLRVLHGVLEPMRASPGVADLRDRLATTTAA